MAWEVTIVLIVPLWNWNHYTDDTYMLDNNVLIVPLWNWNIQQGKTLSLEKSFNCTFMELKFW